MDLKLGLTPEVKKMLSAFLKAEWHDPDFKPLDPVSFNHAFQVFMAQVVRLMKLEPGQVKKLTGLSQPYQLKVQPHDKMEEDVQMSLVFALKFANGLHLNPAHVLDLLSQRLGSMLMMLSPMAA